MSNAEMALIIIGIMVAAIVIVVGGAIVYDRYASKKTEEEVKRELSKK